MIVDVHFSVLTDSTCHPFRQNTERTGAKASATEITNGEPLLWPWPGEATKKRWHNTSDNEDILEVS